MTVDMEKLTNDLFRDEGFRSKPYADSVGKLTIGVGRNLDDVGISKEEAGVLLSNDIERAVDGLTALGSWISNLSEVRQRALTNMAFNLGMSRLRKFRKMLRALERGEWEKAWEEAMDSKWAGQVGVRATRIAHMFRTGEEWVRGR